MSEGADEARPQASMLTIIYTMATQAMIALGEIANPISQQKTVDLRQARWHADSLEILAKKTEGNLDEAEKKALDNVLAEVRMKYVAATKG